MKRLYILKLGTTFPSIAEKYGDFDTWTLAALGNGRIETRVLDVEHGASLPEAAECAGLVMTGSHSMVTDEPPWSVKVERWLPSLLKAATPIFGICYGHQLLARAAGGKVGSHPQGKEIGTVQVRLLPAAATDVLFGRLPQIFTAHATHSQSVLRLPPNATRLASNAYEPNHAFRIGKCAWGVQFHPEFNAEILKLYIEERSVELQSSGSDIAGILSTVEETPVASRTLRDFAIFVEDRLG